MELRQLESFAKVAEHKHFGRAAEEMMVTQPPLSQRVFALERELGVKLLDRTTRRVDLTDAGEALYAHAIDILKRVEATRVEIGELAKGMRGLIRLGVVGSAMYLQLPTAVQAIRDVIPEAEIQVTPEYFTEGQVQMLVDNRLDIGLVRNATPNDQVSVNVLGYESLTVAVRDDDPLNNAVTLQELAGRTILCYPREYSVVGRMVRAQFEPLGAKAPTFIEVPHTSSMLAMVAAGTGVAIVAESAAVLKLPGVRYARIGDMPQVGLEVAFRKSESRALITRAIKIISSIQADRIDLRY